MFGRVFLREQVKTDVTAILLHMHPQERAQLTASVHF